MYHLPGYGEAYMRQSEQEYAQQDRERQQTQLRRRARGMGYELVRIEHPPEA